MSKQVSAEDVFKQGLGDRYQTSSNFEGLLENAIGTPINENEDINGIEEATTNITATGQKPDLITVDEWAEKHGYKKLPKESKDDESGDKSDKEDTKGDDQINDDENKVKED
uniref:Uncharacterized protein n=1 Tax=Panagrolaimus sp. ES5 TaxID=591445 RepID=A0AC34GCY6_9BILA